MNNLFFANNENNERHLEQKCPPPPPPKPPKPPSHKPGSKKKKVDLKKLKKNTCKSLNEVECFLNNFHRFTNYIKLYKILKWSSKMDNIKILFYKRKIKEAFLHYEK
mgnify:CR=1 FL=1